MLFKHLILKLNGDLFRHINEFVMITEEEVRGNHHRCMNELLYFFGRRRTYHYLNALYPIVYRIIHYSSTIRTYEFSSLPH